MEIAPPCCAVFCFMNDSNERGNALMKYLKWLITLLVPLLLLTAATWILNHASYNTLPVFSDWQYLVRIVFYGAVAVYLFYLYQSRYSKKEIAVLVLPLLYLLFFSLPLGIIENSLTLMTFFIKFYPGHNIQVLLFFAYLTKIIVTAMDSKKGELQQKTES